VGPPRRADPAVPIAGAGSPTVTGAVTGSRSRSKIAGLDRTRGLQIPGAWRPRPLRAWRRPPPTAGAVLRRPAGGRRAAPRTQLSQATRDRPRREVLARRDGARRAASSAPPPASVRTAASSRHHRLAPTLRRVVPAAEPREAEGARLEVDLRPALNRRGVAVDEDLDPEAIELVARQDARRRRGGKQSAFDATG
jgi:hypothetical protein